MGTQKSKLTKAMVDGLQPEAKSYRVWDTALPGYFVRVQPSGAKSFAVRYRHDKRNLDFTIGRFPRVTEAMARILAGRKLQAAAGGTDLLADEKAAREARKAARKAAKDARIAQKEQSEQDRIGTVHGFLEHHYAAWANANLKDPAGQLWVLNVEFKHLHDRPLASINPLDVARYSTEKLNAGLSAFTVNRRVTVLKSLLSKAAEWGVIAASPLRGSKPLRTDDSPNVRFLTPDEEQRLRAELASREQRHREARARFIEWRQERGLEAPPPHVGHYVDHLMPMVLLAMNTGMRRGEIFNLTWQDVDLQARTLTVAGAGTKSRQTRHIPLSLEAHRVLTEWKQQCPADAARVFASPSADTEDTRLTTIKSAWLKLAKDAKIPKFRFHDLRHDFASKLVMRGVDLNTVRELLGHADISTTLRYAHLAPEHKAAAVAVLDRTPPSIDNGTAPSADSVAA